MPNYNPRQIEPRWQTFWEENHTFRTPDPGDPSIDGKPKFYILDMFPYPSGAGLHVGHPEGYTATDILARFKRMNGYHVLHPIGWDAFGLPAEQHAIATGIHPAINTQENIATFRRQIKSLGFSYDWDREVDTTDPHYFKWTQWIFLVLFDTWYDRDADKGRPIDELPIPDEVCAQGVDAVRRYEDKHRLAYQAETPVNWCPELGTVLSNEEVIDGKSERGGHPVVRMPLRQWQLRITAYAQRLLDDLEPLEWPESIKKMQRDWVGRSEGAEVDFKLADGEGHIRVFTTRPDTLFGATYMVVAPEHPLVDRITTTEQWAEVKRYQEQAARKSDLERTELAKTKTGVPTGAYAVNPVNGEKIPVWIADYVLSGYGTGAIMAVPGQDERDWEFAEVFDLPIIRTVQPPKDFDGKAYLGEGPAINSDFLDGLGVAEAKAKMIDHLEANGLGTRKVNFKLRDWLFSRQRYWGEPFPILHEVDEAGNPTGMMRPLELKDLPLELPEVKDFKPTGNPEPPLNKATEWVNVTIDGKRYKRETNTMPQWAGSCWYFLRYTDPRNDTAIADPVKLKHWLPVDLYVGGAEHAVLHLLYARFWHKVLFDRGHVPCPEPFQRLINQGMILGEMEFTAHQAEGEWVSSGDLVEGTKYEHVKLGEDQVEKKGDAFVLKEHPAIRVDARAHKMSKSRGNVINPDDVVSQYGADSLRLYEMFMGPLEAVKPWNMRSVEGVYRFLSRVWRLTVDERSEEPKLAETVRDVESDKETLRHLHRTIQKVTEDTAGLRFNTAIAAMMEFTNFLTKLEVRPKSVMEPFVKLVYPYAPHAGEELWRVFGHTDSITYEPWPEYDPEYLKQDEIEIPVSINGKPKSRVMVPAEIGKDELEKAALADEKIREITAGKSVKKVIVVPGKMVNLVVQ